MSARYTWEAVSRVQFDTEEGMPNADGQWVPDYRVVRDGSRWLVKQRTSQHWAGPFASKGEAIAYAEGGEPSARLRGGTTDPLTRPL